MLACHVTQVLDIELLVESKELQTRNWETGSVAVPGSYQTAEPKSTKKNDKAGIKVYNESMPLKRMIYLESMVRDVFHAKKQCGDRH